MTIDESILAGILTRQFMRVEYIDGGGRPRVDVVEGYTLGYNRSGHKILKGFYWASFPGRWYSTGLRTYPVKQITAVELTKHKFCRPQDEVGANDSSEVARIIGDCYFPA